MATDSLQANAVQHTPGPWKVSALDGRTCGPSRLLVLGDATVPQLQAVAIVTLRAGKTEANARLIAAAPELLASLKELRDAAYGNPSWPMETEAADARADAAIAKAEGRS